MPYPVTHVTVKDNPPPQQQRMVIGVYRDISPRREDDVEDDLVRLEEGEETETKVVAPRRGRRPKANEAAETK